MRFSSTLRWLALLLTLALATAFHSPTMQVSDLQYADNYPVPVDMQAPGSNVLLQRILENPEAFAGKRIGVADRVASPLPPGNNRELENAIDQAAKLEHETAARPPCTSLPSASMTPKAAQGLFLACHGDEPTARFVRASLPATDDLDRAEAALAALTSGDLSPRQLDLGLYAPLVDLPEGTSASLTPAGETLEVHFTAPAATFGRQFDTIIGGWTLLEHLALTLFHATSFDDLVFRLNGSCEAFHQAIGGDFCPGPIPRGTVFSSDRGVEFDKGR